MTLDGLGVTLAGMVGRGSVMRRAAIEPSDDAVTLMTLV